MGRAAPVGSTAGKTSTDQGVTDPRPFGTCHRELSSVAAAEDFGEVHPLHEEIVFDVSRSHIMPQMAYYCNQEATCAGCAGGFPLQKGWSDGTEYEPAYFSTHGQRRPSDHAHAGLQKAMTTCLLLFQKAPQPSCDLWDGLGSHGLTFCLTRGFSCHLYTKTNDLILGQGAL